MHSFVVLTIFWLKHSALELLRGQRNGRSRRRERIFVDASFKPASEAGQHGSGGIGVWVPRRRIAITLKVDAKSSMEAEILALLAGALAAKRLGAERPVIFSDCKTAVRIATRHLHVGRARGLLRKVGRLAQLSTEHGAYRHVFDSMRGQGGSLEWQPRENNREADLASNIGSRFGNMGIILPRTKDWNHALNDVLSRALQGESDDAYEHGIVHQSYRCGTRTVSLPLRRPTKSRTFHRQAKSLIKKLSAEVA